jgi:hypothetical protein
MRASFALLSVLVALVLACADMPTLPERPGVENPPDVLSVGTIPARDDGRTPAIVRLVIELGHPFPADAARAGRIVLVTGGADPAEVAAIVHNHTTAALRARFAAIVAWGDPPKAPTRFLVQPTAPLPAGRSTLVLLIDQKPPFVLDLDVVDDAVRARRAWPLPARRSGAVDAWTFCAADDGTLDTALEGAPDVVTLAPSNVVAHVVRRSESPCLDLVPDAPMPAGLLLPPPAIGALAPWPEPIEIGPTIDETVDEHCTDDEVPLDVLCARVDDDRIVLTGNDAAPLLLLGTIGGRAIAEGLAPHARLTVRGLPASSALDLSLVVRTIGGESIHGARIHTSAPHRHLVLNEVLAHPPSGSSLQRFVEVVNDGDRPASLVGLSLADGDRFLELPARTLAPGEFVLITPIGYIDGLGGDVPPSKTIARVLVDALRLTTDLSLVDDEGRVLSRFPGSTSTRSASRGRRTPDRPDDAPDAFGFDAAGKATPGAPNAIE